MCPQAGSQSSLADDVEVIVGPVQSGVKGWTARLQSVLSTGYFWETGGVGGGDELTVADNVEVPGGRTTLIEVGSTHLESQR